MAKKNPRAARLFRELPVLDIKQLIWEHEEDELQVDAARARELPFTGPGSV